MDSASLDRVTFGLKLIDDAIGHLLVFSMEAEREAKVSIVYLVAN